tara:strand:+ start:30 stop:689 length:660 start_codon:yes stop_codon:yes gene_type:complete
MKIICIIPARIGSIRIKKKNLIDFKGKPLIYWTLMQSLRIKLINDIILSSDSNNLLNYSKNYSNKIFLNSRPKKLSTKRSKTESLIKYLIKKYKFSSSDAILILQPTSPLRKDKDIKNIIKIFKKQKLQTLNSASINKRKKTIRKISSVFETKKTKKLIKKFMYSYNGAIYLFKVSYFNKTNKIYEKIPNIYLMDKKNSIDIDNYEDLKGFSNFKININ